MVNTQESGDGYIPSGDIIFDTVLFDLNNNFDMAKGQFVVPKHGFYQFMFEGQARANGYYAEVHLRINGADHVIFRDYTISNNDFEINGMTVVELEDGDLVSLYINWGDAIRFNYLHLPFTFTGFLVSESGTA